jgi:MFS family permease
LFAFYVHNYPTTTKNEEEIIMTLIIIVWILCGFAAAYIADRKGRSVGPWFFCGLIFGLFGVGAAALARTQAELDGKSQRNW